MLSYETAKKLKDTGFYMHPAKMQGKIEQRPEPENHIYYPTLSELIEACGENFRQLLFGTFYLWEEESKSHKDFEGWFAGSEGTGEDGSHIWDEFSPHGFGKIPEEAVANLYLALNSVV